MRDFTFTTVDTKKSCDISVQFPEREGEDTASRGVGGVLKVSPRAQPSAACSLPDRSLRKPDEEIQSYASGFASTHVTCTVQVCPHQV